MLKQPNNNMFYLPWGIFTFLFRACRAVCSRSALGYTQRSGTIARGARIDPSAVVTESTIGKWVRIDRDSAIFRSQLDNYSHLGANCYVSQSHLGEYSYGTIGATLQRAETGKFCSIAAYATIGATNHPMQRVTTHPFTYLSDFGGLLDKDDSGVQHDIDNLRVSIGNDVWIGAQAIILPGVCISDGAVIGANSVVSNDVKAYQVVAGVPARTIRQRFEDDIVEELLRICWWNWDRSIIKARLADFCDIKMFVSKYGSHGFMDCPESFGKASLSDR